MSGDVRGVTRTHPRTLALVLAGGAGGRLELLTEHRAKPAVPYAGTHRLIDFPLSNCLHSGISDVWVLQQFNPVSLTEHLANGRPWDLDRTEGGLVVMHPRLGEGREGWHQGTADALWRHADLIREFAPEALVVVSADAVYRLDYAAVVAEHLESGAEVTMVTTEVEPDEAARYGVVTVDGEKVTDYAYKPDEPAGNLVTNEVFVFRPERTLGLVEELAADAGEEGCRTSAMGCSPGSSTTAPRGRIGWRGTGATSAPSSRTGSRTWTSSARRRRSTSVTPPGRSGPRPTSLVAARLEPSAVVDASLLAPGTRVAGRVERSVLSAGVVVEEGAVVEESVLLPGTVVRAGARVVRAVVDERCDIGPDARLGEDGGDIALVGRGESIDAGSRHAGGARIPEQDDDE
jgi:glucose-1-phosphate adenylyltransferase